MAFSIRLEPFDNIAIEAKVNGSLAARHDDAGALPELRAERLSFGGIWARLVLAAFPHGSDLAKGVSHYIYSTHLCTRNKLFFLGARVLPANSVASACYNHYNEAMTW